MPLLPLQTIKIFKSIRFYFKQFPQNENTSTIKSSIIPLFPLFSRFEETCLRRKNLRLCQQKQASKKPHSCSPPSRSRLFPSHRLVASSPSASVSSVSTITTTGNQGPTNNELIPERYHSLRDAKTYAELRRILDRNGRYLSRAANIGGSQGQCNQWQLRQLRGSNNRTLVTRDDYDDGTKSTCSSSYWSEHNEQRGGGSGTAALLSAKQQQQQQRVRKRERQLSREQCDDTALLRYVRQQQCVTQDSSSVAGSVVVTKDQNLLLLGVGVDGVQSKLKLRGLIDFVLDEEPYTIYRKV